MNFLMSIPLKGMLILGGPILVILLTAFCGLLVYHKDSKKTEPTRLLTSILLTMGGMLCVFMVRLALEFKP